MGREVGPCERDPIRVRAPDVTHQATAIATTVRRQDQHRQAADSMCLLVEAQRYAFRKGHRGESNVSRAE